MVVLFLNFDSKGILFGLEYRTRSTVRGKYSNVFLDVSQNILHVPVEGCVVMIMLIIIIMVRAASVSMAGCWEFHVHHWLIRKVF